MNSKTDLAQNLKIAFHHCTCPNAFHPVWVCMNACKALQHVDDLRSEVDRFLTPLKGQHCNLLIAGAADERTLDLVAQSDEFKQWQYNVADLCQAPLKMATDLANVQGLNLQVIQDNICNLNFDEPLDAVFVFSTFSFMSHEERTSFLSNTEKQLSANGRVFCVVRYFEQFPTETGSDATDWTIRTERDAIAYFAANPDLHDDIKKAVLTFGGSRVERMKSQPALESIVSEAKGAGFTVLETIELEQPWRPEKAGTVFIQQKKVVLVLGHNV